MAFVATISSNEPRSFSMGPFKLEVYRWAAASGDVSGTITSKSLHVISEVVLVGIQQSAQPSISGNVATLALIDPVATCVGIAILMGK